MSSITIEPKENLHIGRAFVEELLYENIRLMDENIKLEFENKRLRKSVEELKIANKRMWLFGLTGDGNVVVVIRKEANRYKI